MFGVFLLVWVPLYVCWWVIRALLWDIPQWLLGNRGHHHHYYHC